MYIFFQAPSHIRFALENGVRLMTFDNEEELDKIAAIGPKAWFLF